MKPLLPALLLAALCVTGCARVQKIVTKAPGASAVILPTEGSDVRGAVRFEERDGLIVVSGRITGLKPGAHGFHVHEKGNCSARDASSAGGHFNPRGEQHGGPYNEAHHLGDLGNIVADATGVAEFSIEVKGISLGTEPTSVVGRSVIVHADPDDLVSQPTGNAGGRLACGLISRDP